MMPMLSWLAIPEERRVDMMDLSENGRIFRREWLVAAAREAMQDPYVLEGRLEGRIRELANLDVARGDDVDRIGDMVDTAVQAADGDAHSTPPAQARPGPAPVHDTTAGGATTNGKVTGLAVEAPPQDARIQHVFEELAADEARQGEFDAFVPRIFTDDEIRALFAEVVFVGDYIGDPEVFAELVRFFNSKEYQFNYLRDGVLNVGDVHVVATHLDEFMEGRRKQGRG
jgi:hypothetical protein